MVYKLEEKYQWRSGNYPVSADDAHKEIERINKKEGCVTAQNVLDQSRPKKAVLHDCFEWDDNIASEKWRLHQSACLIGNLVKVACKQVESEEPKEVTVRAYVNTENNRYAKKGSYVSINVAVEDERLYKVVLDNALKELKAFKAKYATLDDLSEVFKAIDTAVENAQRKGA